MTNDEMTPAIKEPTVTHESKKKNKKTIISVSITEMTKNKKKCVPFHPKLSIRNIKKIQKKLKFTIGANSPSLWDDLFYRSAAENCVKEFTTTVFGRE